MKQKLTEMLKKHEGLKLKPYKCTAGKLTIGYGRNLDDNGIRLSEAEAMLANDIALAEKEIKELFPCFLDLSEARQAVLIDMLFNLGKVRLAEFRRFRKAILEGNFEQAEVEMLDSAWANQVPNRANELAHMMLTGRWE